MSQADKLTLLCKLAHVDDHLPLPVIDYRSAEVGRKLPDIRVRDIGESVAEFNI